MASRIEDYALIGDCETAALVGVSGSIDWLCWPRFDSDACFAALLGSTENGHWRIAPDVAVRRTTRVYRGPTLILETTFHCDEGRVKLVDFMPPRGTASDVVRIVIGESGRVPMRMELVLRFGYGANVPWLTRMEDGGLRAVSGPDMVVLRTPLGLRDDHPGTTARFSISKGEAIPLVLTYSPSHLDAPAAIDPLAALADTETFWRDWSGQGQVEGAWADAITRSLITLKALTYAPTGGVVAAPTTSLPERLGGERNWDYRYCWLRDATLTLLALMNAGYYDEARAWRDWLLRTASGHPQQMQIMYGLGGERRLVEWQADWLGGYEGSRPVRVGNAAHGQRQLDVYGEIMDALHHARRGLLCGNDSGWALQRALLDHLETIWNETDAGLWETRGPNRQFTHSKIMAWVAVDRAVKSIEKFGLEGPLDHWKALRTTIHEDVCTKAFDRTRNTFVQSYGGDALDASLLLIPQVGFLPPEDPRVAGTVEAIEHSLLRDGFVLRYDTRGAEDGLPSGEGAFLACSFWLVDAYTMLGRRRDAAALFKRLLAIRNDVGLLAEEYDVDAGRQVGNFPQAFSHVGLVNSAMNLTRADTPAEQRAERAAAAPRDANGRENARGA